MERVKKGETYWYIFIQACDDIRFDIVETTEANNSYDNEKFSCGNYFNTKEQAKAVVRKLRAVTEGGEVLRWPSEDEIREVLQMRPMENDKWKEGFCDALFWIQSKFIK